MSQSIGASSPNAWRSVLTLDSDRRLQTGSAAALNAAIRRGADLRIMTQFRYHEHVEPGSADQELIREICDFQTVYQLEDRWTAGIMTLRQPVSLPDGFGPRPSMSFFLYNQDGEQGIARPYLDGRPIANPSAAAASPGVPHYPRYHQHDDWDPETNAPSHNFVYEFDLFDYIVRDDWREVLAHDEYGSVRSGSIDALAEGFNRGCQVKVAIHGLCRDLNSAPGDGLDHEVMVQAGSCYYYTTRQLIIAGTNPLVRVRPAIPLKYASAGWDCGWCVVRTDGRVVYRALDPQSLSFGDYEQRHPLRWFVR